VGVHRRFALPTLALTILISLAACGGFSPPSAQSVVDDFAAAGLAVPKARDNSRNCDDLGCEQLVTTDAMRIYTFSDAAAQKMATNLGDGGHLEQGVLPSYLAARTPED